MHGLVVGSSVIDLFLKLSDTKHAHISNRVVSFTLGDKIPTNVEKLTLGGNGANVSVGLTRLGIATTFFTYLGSDILSQHIETTIKNEGVTMLIEKNSDTSSLSLIFNFDTDRVIFSHHPSIQHHFRITATQNFDFVYLTSIGANWEETYKKVAQFAKDKGIPLAVSPGSYELKDMNETLLNTISNSYFLFVNKEEAEIILHKAGIHATSEKEMLEALHTIGPTVISMTDGSNGAYAFTEDQAYYIKSTEEKAVEKTGAGDSYTSGFIAAYLAHKSVELAMKWGSINATSVMQYVGAQEGLLNRIKMEKKANDYSHLEAKRVE